MVDVPNGPLNTQGMSDDEDSNRPLEAHGMVMKHDFMRAAGLSEQQFNRLQAEGLIEVFFRGDEAFGLRDDTLPTAATLRAVGIPVPDDYLDRLQIDLPPDHQPTPGAATWTIGWD